MIRHSMYRAVPVVALLMGVARASAQTATGPASTPAESIASPNAPDTPPGPPHTFADYAHPDECARAAAWQERAFWRTRRLDTAYFARTGHPEQPSTIAAVRTCLSRFHLGTVPTRDLLGLGEALLAADQVDDADRAFAVLMDSVATGPVSVKTWAMRQIVSVYTHAAQPQVERAAHYVAQLDAMGAAAVPERLLSHLDMAELARFRDSVALEAQEAKAALKASGELTGDARREYAFSSAQAYGEMALLRVRQNDGPGARAFLTVGRNALVPLRPRVELAFDLMEHDVAPVGLLAAVVQATQWYNTGAAGNTRPIAGKPSLIVFASFRAENDFPGYGMVRRLAAKYAARGVDVTFIVRTRGYINGGGEVVRPDSEAVRIREYFLDELQLPVALAVTLSDFGHRSDGKLELQSMANESAYHPAAFVSLPTYVVDAHGLIRMVTNLSRDNEAVIDDVLGELLTHP